MKKYGALQQCTPIANIITTKAIQRILKTGKQTHFAFKTRR
jgi:hypothetical protein